MSSATSFVLSDVSYNVGDSIYFDPRVLEEGSTEQTHPHVPGYIAASGRDPKVEEILSDSFHILIEDMLLCQGSIRRLRPYAIGSIMSINISDHSKVRGHWTMSMLRETDA